jgi:serine O-acetyltransferase
MATLLDIIRDDLYRYRGNTSLRAFLSAYIKDPGFRFVYYLRKVAFYRKWSRSVGLIAYAYNRVVLNHYRFKYGFDISPAATIGPGFYLSSHFGKVVIGQNAVIGANCNIAHGVTLGTTQRGRYKGTPTLGDRVWVGADATIMGKVRIGNDALIGPNTFVNRDVPPGAVVLGNPGKIISFLGSEDYVNFRVSVGAPLGDHVEALITV